MTTKRDRTADQMAVDLLLAGDQVGLTRLAARMRARDSNRATCPECGDRGEHEDNGEIGPRLAFSCRACGCHFDADDAAEEVRG